MKSNILTDKIMLIQKEYKELLLTLLPKLQSDFAPEALDEINLFWLRNINMVRLYLDTILPRQDSYLFTAATYLDYDDNEHLPFLVIGQNHILDDPLSSYSELCSFLPDKKNINYLYKQISVTAEDNIKVLENLTSIVLILPLRLLVQSDAHDTILQMSEQLFISLFNGIENINEYFIKCSKIEDILHYANNSLLEITMFSETDNKMLSLKERFIEAINRTEFIVDPSKPDAYNFFMLVYGNILQAISIFNCCIEYGCIPYIRNPVSFHYLYMITNSIMQSEYVAILQLKMIMAFILHHLCNKDLLAKVDIKELIKQIQSYKFDEKILSRFDVENIVGTNHFEHLLKQVVNEELECFYKYISADK